MIDLLLRPYKEYYKKYNDFPVVFVNLDEELQVILAETVQNALDDNRELTKKEIQRFQENGIGILY